MKRGILLEGCDCTGKSTLAKYLRRQLHRDGWDIFSMAHRDGDQCDRYLKAYVNANKLIFDRGHFSEIAYGNVWRNGVHFTKYQLDFLNEYTLSVFVVVFSFAEENLMKERWKEKEDQKIKRDELIIIQNEFESLLDDPRVIRYESRDVNSLTETVGQIIKRVGRSSSDNA